MIHLKGTLQYDPERGVVYFHDEASGQCALRIEGIPMVPEGNQIEVHLISKGCEHHHARCGVVLPHPLRNGVDPDRCSVEVVCAVKLETVKLEKKV